MNVDATVLQAARSSLPGSPQVELHDSFFALGGTSLDALRFVGELEDLFDCTLPMAEVVAATSFEAVSACVEAALREPDPEEAA